MSKKFIILIILILFLIAGGVFWWWQSGKELRELNKNLVEGIKVEKSLLGQYKVVNKKEGYEIKIPNEWSQVKEIRYNPKQEGLIKDSLELTGIKEGSEYLVYVHSLELNGDINLESWLRDYSSELEEVSITKEKIGNFEVIKLEAPKHLAEISYYFKVNSKVYIISSPEKDFIPNEIILNSKW